MKIPSLNVIKFVQQGPKVSHVDDLNKALTKFDGYLEFPNGQKANNMLDAFIYATGTKVDDYEPSKVVDFLV